MLKYIIFALLYFSAFVSLNDDLNPYALYCAIPLAFGLSFINGGNCIGRNKYISILLIMYVWITFTTLFASHTEAAYRDLRACLGAILLCVTIANMAQKGENIKWLYGMYLILFIAAIQYAGENIITTGYNIATDRVNDEKLNANTIAYYTFFVTYSIGMLGDIVKHKASKIFFRIAFILTIPLSFFVAIFTASRQVLIIQVPLIAFLLYIRYYNRVSFGKKIIVSLVAIIILFFIAGKAISIYSESYLSQRNTKSYEEDVRIKIMATAFNVGCQNPVFGVGPANFIFYNPSGHFSHCTYVELFANSGFPAAFLFLYMLWLFVKKNWNYYRRTKNKEYLVFVVFGLIYAFDNFFYVFHNSLWLIGFFALVSSESISFNKQEQNSNAIRVSKQNQSRL